MVWGLLAAGLVGFGTTARAESASGLVKQGNALVASQNYDDALALYEKAGVNAPESPYLYFNKGTALYGKGDYAAATEAFRQAALKSRDIELEAQSKFNLGLCAVKNAERQQDSDLNKALEAFGQSIQHFREALDLKPDFREAAENIEVVRLMMRTILDELKKQEEEAQKQQEQAQQAAKDIEALIERQQALLDRNNMLAQEAQQNGVSGAPDDMQALAGEQGTLKDDTQQVAENLAAQPPNVQAGGPGTAQQGGMPQNSPPPEAVQHLGDSVKEQEQAVQQFDQNQSKPASEHQQNSLEALNKALESLKDDQQQQQQGQQQQQEEQGQGQQEQQGEQGKQPQPEQNEQPSGSDQNQEEQQQASAAQLPDDAESILDEEKTNNMRRTQQQAPGGYSEVSKDW